MNEKRRMLVVSTLTAVWAGSPAFAAEFRGFIQNTVEYGPYVGDVDHWDYFTMSDNGQAIVGYARTDEPGIYQSYRWTFTSGIEWLPFPGPPHIKSWGCLAQSLDRTGSKVFMDCTLVEERWPWDVYVLENGTFTKLPRTYVSARVCDATPNGDVAVGYDYELDNAHGVRWDAMGETDLGRPDAGGCNPGADDESEAHLVSDNGAIVAGYTGEFYGGPYEWEDYSRLVVWDGIYIRELDMFGFDCGDEWMNNLNGMSGDGSIVVGGHPIPAGDNPYQPVWWNTSDGAGNVLPLLPGAGHLEGVAYCTNREGSLVGGASGDRGVVWNRIGGGPPRLVEHVLHDAGLAPEIAGWKLTTVYQMSGDGKQLAGHGIAPDGNLWNWWADLRDPPDNDLCLNARDITPNHTTVPLHIFTETFTVTGSTAEASGDAPHSCATTIEPTVNIWYKYTAPVDGYLYLDLCDTGSSLLNPFIAVHTGCPGSGASEVICRNDCAEVPGCDRPCVMPPWLHVSGGETYYIQVGGAADAGHAVTLKHRFLPHNDECDDAAQIVEIPSTTPGTTTRMGVDPAAVCNEQIPTASGVWYTVMGLGTTMTASTCGLADYDTQISVFCGGCGGMACVGFSDDACKSQSAVSWCAARGMVYHILVHGDSGDSGTFQIEITHDSQRCTPTFNCHPANEVCENAFPVPEDTTYADNTGANTSSIAAFCAPSGRDVWYSYTARCDGELWVDTCQVAEGSMVNSVVSVYDDCSGTQLACNDDYSDSTIDCGLRSAAIAQVTQNQDVRIRVAGYGTPGHQGSFPLRVSEVPAPLTIASSPLPDAFANDPYNVQLEYHGSCGPRRFTAAGLPPGLTIDSGTGVISGVPTAAGHYVIGVEVCDNILPPDGQCADGEVFLRVWPSNDDCAQAMNVTEGLYGFGNVGATTDGPDEPDVCDFSGYTHVESDLWYRYTSSCDGIAIVDACESNYDGKMAVYAGGVCPTETSAWICDDDTCPSMGPWMGFPVSEGEEYLLRVGGYLGGQGQGELMITCFDDCNSNEQSDLEEIISGAASDCNGNLHPDECELSPVPEDCRFPVRLLENTTGYGDSNFIGPPDDIYIGLGGQTVTYDFHCALLLNGEGPDFTVYEADRGADEFGAIDVFVSLDGVGYISVKASQTTAVDIPGDETHGYSSFARSYDLSAAGMAAARYVRIDGNGTGGSGSSTAFDLDAIGAVHLLELDCNGNGVLDECDITDQTAADCNSNHVPDDCELSRGVTPDCNNNSLPDDCDIADASSHDINGNGIPDECEVDCNDNSVPDDWDIVDGTSIDCNNNEVPDECDLLDGTSYDCNDDDRPDECPVCPTIEAVFIMDTSSSMTGEAGALCTGITQVVSALQADLIDVDAELLGISAAPGGSYACLTDYVMNAYGTAVPGSPPPGNEVLGDCPGGNEVASEDWARAVSVVAGTRSWLSDSIGVVVPLSDEGPWCGDPVSDPGVDRDAIDHAILVARENDVIVSPITGTGSGSGVIALAQELADGTGGVQFSSAVPAADLATALSSLLVDACATASDCNDNSVPDACDLRDGASEDCNDNEVPDECDLRGDANANGVLDVADWPSFGACLADPCGSPPCSPALYPHPCCSWVDFDEDGDVDLVDVAVFQEAFTGPLGPFDIEICDNWVDDDADGWVDCDDPDCEGDPACGGPVEVCDNWVDDDADGWVDCDDPDCEGDPACGGPVEACDNWVDDDADGWVDCDDPDCEGDPACGGPVEVCDNWVDDDADGWVDCDDPDCEGDPACW